MKIFSYLLAWFYRKSQLAYEKYLVDKYRGMKSIKLSESTIIFPESSLEGIHENSIIIGNNTAIRGRIVTFPNGGKVSIGDDCYVGSNTQIWSEMEIFIGDRVLIAHNCNIFDSSTHPIDKEERHDQFMLILKSGFPVKDYTSLHKQGVIIEDDAWIAANCTILKGVHIGRGAIVSANSVVVSDVPPNVIVAGNPAKIIKKLG